MLGKRVRFQFGSEYMDGHVVAIHRDGDLSIMFEYTYGHSYDDIMEDLYLSWEKEIESNTLFVSHVNVDRSLKYERFWREPNEVRLTIENIE